MAYSTTRRNYADAFIRSQKRILSRYFGFPEDEIHTADFNMDVHNATDFVLPNGIKVAARVRRPQYRDQYFGQFTVRTTGQLSELDKLEWGRADFVLYGYADDDAGNLSTWWLMEVRKTMFSRLVEQLADFNSYEINPSVVRASYSDPDRPIKASWNN